MPTISPISRFFLCLTYLAVFHCTGCDRPTVKDNPPNAVAQNPTAPRPQPSAVNVPSAFELSVDPQRLKLPQGIGQFWRDYNTEMVPLGKVEEVLATARAFEKLDQHKAYYFEAIPVAKFKCALALSKSGQHEKALAIMEEIRTKGYLPAKDFSNSVFDPIRDDSRFKALKEFAEKESDADSVGPYLVLQTPLFKLEELLSVPTNPPLPTADALRDTVTVILTAPALTRGLGGDDAQLLENLVGTSANILVIVGQAPANPIQGVQVNVASVDSNALLIDRTRMLWIADKRGQVVYNLRLDAYYNKNEPKLVIEYLQTH